MQAAAHVGLRPFWCRKGAILYRVWTTPSTTNAYVLGAAIAAGIGQQQVVSCWASITPIWSSYYGFRTGLRGCLSLRNAITKYPGAQKDMKGSEMKLRNLVPVLDVQDVEESILFYCDTLGFEVHDKVTWGGRTEWALLRSGEVQLMLCASRTADEEAAASGDGVFSCIWRTSKLFTSTWAAKDLTGRCRR